MEPTENMANYRLGIFYFNKTDNRFVIPKKTQSLGWTFNFAHLKTYLFFAAIFIIIFLAKYPFSHFSLSPINN